MRLTESKLKYMLEQCLNEALAEEYFGDFNAYEGKKKKKSESTNKKDNDEGGSKSTKKRRKRVIEFLRQDSVDVAQYAYDLWPEKARKNEDSCRSYFYKCLNNEENDNGVPYEFSDDEIVSLYSMISNNTF